MAPPLQATQLVIIARQRAQHAERDIALPTPSVRPSVRHVVLLYLNLSIFPPAGRGVNFVFDPVRVERVR